jgi:hypothetical protein
MDYYSKYLKYKSKYLNLKNGGGKQCTIAELMQAKEEGECNNETEVAGSCGEPSWKDGYSFHIGENDYNTIIEALNNIPESIQNIEIILGSRKTGNDKNIYYLTIDPIMIIQNSGFDNIKHIKSNFPLRIDGKFDIDILNKIINFSKSKKVKIINKMCGTCHRSLYYLVKNGIDYEVSPEQGLGVADTEDIKKCFRYSSEELQNKIAIELSKIPRNIKKINELKLLLNSLKPQN